MQVKNCLSAVTFRQFIITALCITMCTSVIARNAPPVLMQKPNRLWRDCVGFPMIGVNGFTNLIFEVGYQWHCWGDRLLDNGMEFRPGMILQGSMEFQVVPDFRMNPKLSFRWSERLNENDFHVIGGFDYLRLKDGPAINHVIRPVVGFGNFLQGADITYGYNFSLDSNEYILGARHNIQLSLSLFWIYVMMLE